MAWIQPELDWTAEDSIIPADFLRVEGNIDYLKDALDVEVADRQAGMVVEIAARNAAIAVEADARYAADALKQNLPSAVTNYNLADFPIGTTIMVFSETMVPRTWALSPLTQSGSGTVMYTTTYEAGQIALAGSWLARGGFRHYHSDLEIQGWIVLAQRVA